MHEVRNNVCAGQVNGLQDVTMVSLGKAHVLAVTTSGHLWTFGINNKGQCGREFQPNREGILLNLYTQLL